MFSPSHACNMWISTQPLSHKINVIVWLHRHTSVYYSKECCEAFNDMALETLSSDVRTNMCITTQTLASLYDFHVHDCIVGYQLLGCCLSCHKALQTHHQ